MAALIALLIGLGIIASPEEATPEILDIYSSDIDVMQDIFNKYRVGVLKYFFRKKYSHPTLYLFKDQNVINQKNRK